MILQARRCAVQDLHFQRSASCFLFFVLIFRRIGPLYCSSLSSAHPLCMTTISSSRASCRATRRVASIRGRQLPGSTFRAASDGQHVLLGPRFCSSSSIAARSPFSRSNGSFLGLCALRFGIAASTYLRCILSFSSNTTPSFSRIARFLKTLGAFFWDEPEKPPIVRSEATTLCQGTSQRSNGFRFIACPTARALFLFPSSPATPAYVITRPAGMVPTNA